MNRDEARAIEWDCAQLLLRFYVAFDAWDYDSMARSFTDDGVWHRAGKALKGRAEILAELQRRPTTQVIRHVVSNIVVDVQNDAEATATLYIVVYRYDDGKSRRVPAPLGAPVLLMLVSARLARVAEGWQIAEQTMQREFEAPA